MFCFVFFCCCFFSTHKKISPPKNKNKTNTKTHRLQALSKKILPKTILFQHPTISALVEAISEKGEEGNEIVTGMTSVSKEREDIAIIGMSCRFPGSESTEEFWDLLIKGGNAISEIPKERFGDSTKMFSIQRGGFIKGIDLFDPEFFGISNFEARYMDPQQRIALEETWRAMEKGGIVPESMLETRTGIFVGLWNEDYFHILKSQEQRSAFTTSGGSSSMATGRIAYILGTRGPAMTVSTACSSSMVALHLGVGSLMSGETDFAICGGVNLILSAETSNGIAAGGFLSPDGQCKTFDESANGYVRSEGCGIVILKRLSQVHESNRGMAIVKGTAVNQDGKRNGLTAPNGVAQEAVIRAALATANKKPEEIDAVEAHGTGTALGDPIEMEALSAVFGRPEKRRTALIVASAKTNVGHLESASGMVGLVKIVLALEHEKHPPHLHLKKVNHLIDVEAIPVRIPQEPISWKRREDGTQRAATISSFGFSGTNTNTVVCDTPRSIQDMMASRGGRKSGTNLLLISARSEGALRDLARRYSEAVGVAEGTDLGALCAAAALCRAHHAQHRAAVVVVTAAAGPAAGEGAGAGAGVVGIGERQRQQRMQVAARLREIAESGGGSAVSGASVSAGPAARVAASGGGIAFLFTGQGSQYENAGRELYEDAAGAGAA